MCLFMMVCPRENKYNDEEFVANSVSVSGEEKRSFELREAVKSHSSSAAAACSCKTFLSSR